MGLRTSLPGGTTARKLGMVGLTFASAMGIGFFMQQGDASASLSSGVLQATGAAPSQAIAASAIAPAPDVDPSLALPERDMALADRVAFDTMPDAEIDTTGVPMVEPVLAEIDEDTNQALAARPLNCEPSLTARATEAAMVELSVDAPCTSGASFTIHHEGMMFTAMTDVAGGAKLMAPALSERSVFIAAFDDGTGAVADVAVPELTLYDRVVLQWRGQSGLEIHAMEFGAEYGQPGHVWRHAARSPAVATTGTGGFLMQLGDARTDSPLMAEVYTFPSGKAPQDGQVTLSVEAEVTAENCATEVEAQTLRRSGAENIKISDLVLSVPECEAIGDFMVLKNLLPDLTLAQG